MERIASGGLGADIAAFRDDTRLYGLEGAGAEQLVVERWHGWDALSAGFDYTLDCLSTDARLPLNDLLGQRLSLRMRLANGEHATRTGLVFDAEHVGAEGGLARYRLRLRPWIHLLGQGRRSRLYQDRSILQILDDVFARYAPLASWHVSDEVGGFLSSVRPRSDCFQYRESDWGFVTRLLAEEGLGFYVEEHAESPAGHRLMIFADSRDAAEDAISQAEGGVRFHRDAATEAADSVQALGAVHVMGPTELTWISHDYKSNSALSARTPLNDAIESVRLEQYANTGPYAFATQAEAERYQRLAAEALEAGQNSLLGLGSARSFRPGTWFRLTQAPTGNGQAMPTEILLSAVRHLGVNNLPPALAEQAAAMPSPSGDEADAWPELTLPLELSAFLQQTEAPAQWRSRLARVEAIGYANSFRALPRDRPWRPRLHDETGARWNPRPTVHGLQTARVVGPDGATSASGAGEIYCDQFGRVKVQLHFQDDDSPPATGWLRVNQQYAGPDGVGLMLLPRIGMEVLIAFLNSDVDRPVILRCVYGGRGEAGIPATPGGQPAQMDTQAYAQARDHRPSAQGNLAGGNAPAWHGAGTGDDAHRNAAALSGVKSKEFGGDGYNQLVFDDSDGQLRIQIATTQAASQFNVGHLIHQADNYRGSFRGQGWELRTDAWGAVRAPAGLWLSTYPAGDDAAAGEVAPAVALLKQAATVLETWHGAATTHHTVGYASHQGVRAANTSQLLGDQPPVRAALTSAQTTVPSDEWHGALAAAGQHDGAAADGRVPHSGDGLIGVAARAGLGMVAGQGMHWLTGETLALVSGAQTNWAVAGNLRVQTGQAIGLLAGAQGGEGLMIVAAQGALDVQAQQDVLKVQARDQLKLLSVNAAVEIAAGKRVVLKTAQGASLTIEGGNIVWACPGEFRVHAGKKDLMGPVQVSYPLPVMPQSTPDETPCRFRFTLQDIPGPVGVALKGEPWQIVRLKQAREAASPFEPKAWHEVLAEGATDDAGQVQLSDAQNQEIWNAVRAHPERVHLLYGHDAVLIRRNAFAMSDGQRDIFDTLEANNYIRHLEQIPGEVQLVETVDRAVRDFESLLSGAPKDRTKA